MEGVIKKISCLLAILIITSASLFAQTGVGKLAGKITDTETGEALIGANIAILNTNLGAATDVNGEYFILNITPGNYDIRISYVGYGTKTINGVRIVSGITYELNESLTSGIEIEMIEVTAEKKFFEPKSTNTVKVVDSEQIAALPVKGVSNIAALQSGVVSSEGSGGSDGNASINVRGGRSTEVLYIIDGIPQNNVLSGSSVAQVSDNAIDQLAFQVGGYEAKYGQAQSGIINVTTKSGQPFYNLFADGITSEFTDDYGYNLYSLNLSGPIIPGNKDHSFFLSAERGWFADRDPSAIDISFESIDASYDKKPNNDGGVYRFTGRTKHNFGPFSLNLGANINMRSSRSYIHSYAKNNSQFFPKFDQDNYSFNARLSQTVSATTFWNLNVGVKRFASKQYDPHFGDNLLLYGDSTYLYNTFGIELIADGQRVLLDENGVFYDYGRVNNYYEKQETDNLIFDLDVTTQQSNHLLEIGGGFNYNIVRFFGIGPVNPTLFDETLTLEERFEAVQPTVFGYDVMGEEKTDVGSGDFAPKTPLFGYVYIQDRFELEDLILNLGVRVDYFDTKEDVLKDPSLPYAGGTDPLNFDAGDYKEKEAEIEISPRIGLGFPVTESTVFHAQYGRFIQMPNLNDLYNGPYDLLVFQQMEPQYVRTGILEPEETIQYELGLRQLLGNNSALNITAFYKNIRGLVNRATNFYQRQDGGEILSYIAPTNSDFGTTKGLAISFDVTRLSNFNISAQYTFSIAEGTGSSTSSSQTSVFRNQTGEAPKVIAPLDFDQTHTAVLNLNYSVPKGEGILEMLSATMLLSFNSGRPYTPLDYYDILSGNNGGPSTTGYINSRRMPGRTKIDLKVEKSFEFGSIRISPYVWIENLLDSDNIVGVYRSTGDPYTTGFLNTAEGASIVNNRGEGYKLDYESLERNPGNFGIPRLIKLGLKVNFGNITF